MRLVLSGFTVAIILEVGLTAQPWWKTATFYQIYPRSFMDYDNDGVGDLKGITAKVEYLAELGVTAVWMNPIYPSPLADFGYDISDFKAIDPLFGTLDDLNNLISAFHAKDIKVVMDFVPNHSSDQHPWFSKSINMEGNYSNYYVWKEARVLFNGTKTVPNNWISVFGGSAWEWNERRQQYYLHQFLAKQPDLNYRDENVKREMMGIMEFWLNLGIDGIRVDAAKYLVEDDQFRDNPLKDDTLPVTQSNIMKFTYTQNLNLTFQLVKDWSELVKQKSMSDGKDRILLLEIYDTIETVNSYSGGTDYPFTIPFNFFLVFQIVLGCTATTVLESVNSWLNAMPEGSTPNWQVGNHDRDRVSTRAGTDLVDSVNMILAMLPGIMSTYYGEELGMENTFVTFEQTVDVIGKNLGKDNYQTRSRDPERTPLQWDDGLNSGFCTNCTTWLPVNTDYWSLNIAAQKAASTSHLKVYQNLMALRKSDTFQSNTTKYKLLAPDDDTFAILRWAEVGKRYLLIVNFGSTVNRPFSNSSFGTTFNIENITQFTVHTAGINAGYREGEIITKSKGIVLRPKAGVILQFPYELSSASSLLTSTTFLRVIVCCFTLFFIL